ncbi:MAG: MBL fold metallo-hydrolase [Solobacterium sp.]|nr:MBL fold metallo-hydrolase [Solobacterium sp.]
MGIKKPLVLEVAHRTYAINEFGMATCFLLWGTERGLLIDTGCGMYNIREIADELCPLPYDVVITHSHGDHYGYMDAWDEVWIHPDDIPNLTDEKLAAWKNRPTTYLDMMATYGTTEAYEVTQEQCHHPEHAPKLIPCPEGTVFDLGGGRKVDVIHTPGHSEGEIVLIDPTTRILFSGDACNGNLGIRSTSMNKALKGLLKVKAREADFDRNFNAHIGYGGDNVHKSQVDGILDDCLYIMTGLVKGTIKPEYTPNPWRPGSAPVYLVKHGNVVITCEPDNIIGEDEEPAV